MWRRVFSLAAIVSCLIAAPAVMGAAQGQGGLPPFPIVYIGNVAIQGQPASEGLSVVGCVGGCSAWESTPVLTTEDSKYVGLTIRAPEALLDEEITFWIVVEGVGRIRASQTDTYSPDINVQRDLNLDFDQAVPTPLPPTATPTPTRTPQSTSTPVLPIPGDPSVSNMPRLALLFGVAAVVIGGVMLYLVRRPSRAF